MNLIILHTLLALHFAQTLGRQCTCNCNCNWKPEWHHPKIKFLPKDCQEILDDGLTMSGVYTIYPGGEANNAVDVYCDQKTNGGGWTVFQRRQDNTVNFFRKMDAYKKGFGTPSGNFWLGLDTLAKMTASKAYTLRVDLENWKNDKRYAEYGRFVVGPANTRYKLDVRSYSGNAGDSLKTSNGQKFTTKDQDNDLWGRNCAKVFKGAWWYNKCHESNLNGKYFTTGPTKSYADGVVWNRWKGFHYSMKKSEMKIRPSK